MLHMCTFCRGISVQEEEEEEEVLREIYTF
jgi:hypothetical protein